MNNHPDNPSFPHEIIQPPDQTTLQNIVDGIAELTQDQFDFGPDHDSLRARVHEPGSTKQAGTVCSYKVDEEGNYPQNKVASIHLAEDASHFGDKIHTNYTIIKTPDGDLFIEKNLKTSNRAEQNIHPANNDEVAIEALKLLVRVVREDKAEKIQNAMGLNYVDHDEAAGLLERVGRLKPFDDHDMDKKTAEWIRQSGPKLH